MINLLRILKLIMYESIIHRNSNYRKHDSQKRRATRDIKSGVTLAEEAEGAPLELMSGTKPDKNNWNQGQ